MRRMSFSRTKRQYLDHSKDVTRRLGWLVLVGCAPREHRIMGVEKAMGLRRGEKQVLLGPADILDARREPLSAITDEDVEREGFPGMSREWFVEMYMGAYRCQVDQVLTRIVFKQDFPPVRGAD